MLKELTRLLNSRVPHKLPIAGVLTYFPNLNNPVQATCGGAGNAYGNNATALLAAGNATGVWVVGIHVNAFSNNNIDYHICVNADPTGALPITVLGELPFWSQTTVVADHSEYVPFYRPVYFPPATIICVAASSGGAAADTVTVWVVGVVNMDN